MEREEGIGRAKERKKCEGRSRLLIVFFLFCCMWVRARARLL